MLNVCCDGSVTIMWSPNVFINDFPCQVDWKSTFICGITEILGIKHLGQVLMCYAIVNIMRLFLR